MRLPELQNSFVHALFTAPEQRLMLQIDDALLSAKDRLAAYKNNVYVGLFEALKSAFPTVINLGGEDFFRAAVHHFVKMYPPQTAVLDEYGARLPSFLAQYAPAQSHPYLPDMAALDWAIHECSVALDDATLRRETLQQTLSTVAEHPLPLRAAVRLVQSFHPLTEIWHFCQQPDKTAPVTMAKKQRFFIIYRCDDFSVWHESISIGTHAGLKALGAGMSLQKALQNALQADATFDASAFLLFCMMRDILKAPRIVS